MTEQVCAGCDGTNITYQAFSGGREYYCRDCDDTFPYDDAARPPRLQMLVDGRYDELRAQMRAALDAMVEDGEASGLYEATAGPVPPMRGDDAHSRDR